MSSKPTCVIVTGRPGSGKTTLANQLGELLWMPVISRDAIKQGYVNTYGISHDQLPPDTNARVSNLFFEIVYQYLAGKISVVIEAAFQHQVWEPRMARISGLSDPYLVVCSIDALVAADRHLQRALNEPRREFYHGDARAAAYRQTGVMPPPDDYAAPNFDLPTLHVSTERGYAPGLDELVKRIK